MNRNLESRLAALEAASGRESTDVVIHRLKPRPGAEPTLKTADGAKQWLCAVGESFKDFTRRAFSELDIPNNGMRVLILEGNP